MSPFTDHIVILSLLTSSLAERTMGILRYNRLRVSTSNPGIISRDCFEQLCTSPTKEESGWQFFTVVNRKLGDLDVVMPGQVDCRSSAGLDFSICRYQPNDFPFVKVRIRTATSN